MEDELKSLLASKNEEIIPRKIVKVTFNEKTVRTGIVLNIGIGTFTMVRLTSSVRFSKIPELNLMYLIKEDEHFVKFTNISHINLKRSVISVEVIGEVPEIIYNSICNILLLSFLGYSRLEKDDEGIEYWRIIKPKICLDNPILTYINSMYNPEEKEFKSEEAAPVPSTPRKISKKRETSPTPEKVEKPNEEKTVEEARDILKDLEEAGVFDSTSIDERIDKIFDVFNSYGCYKKDTICISNAYRAMFEKGSLRVVGSNVGVDKATFKLYVVANRFALEKQFKSEDMSAATIDRIKCQAIGIYLGKVNTIANISEEVLLIATNLKENGITRRPEFIDAFYNEARKYYNTDGDAYKAAYSLYSTVHGNWYTTTGTGTRLSLEEKKEKAISYDIVSKFDKGEKITSIIKTFNEENASFYSSGVYTWEGKGEDPLFDSIVLYEIYRIFGTTGKETFFILSDKNRYILDYFLNTDFKDIVKRFSRPNNLDGVFYKFIILAELKTLSAEDKSKLLINRNDPEKLSEMLSINFFRSFSGKMSNTFIEKISEMTGLDTSTLITVCTKYNRFSGDKYYMMPRKNRDKKKDKEIDVDKEIAPSFISAANRMINNKDIPYIEVDKLNDSIPTCVAIGDLTHIGLTSEAFEKVCKDINIKIAIAKDALAAGDWFNGDPIRSNSYLTKVFVEMKEGDPLPVNVYKFSRANFDSKFTKSNVEPESLRNASNKISDTKKVQKPKEEKEPKLTKKEKKEKAKKMFDSFSKTLFENLGQFTKIEYGKTYHDIPKGIVYYTDAIIGLDAYTFETICAIAGIKSAEFKSLIAEFGYIINHNKNKLSASRVSIPTTNNKNAFVNIYSFSKKILINANNEAIATSKTSKDVLEEPSHEVIEDVIPETPSKEQKKVDIKGDYATRFINMASKAISEKKITLYPVGEYLDYLPNRAAYYNEEMVAFDKAAFEFICNEAALPLQDTQKELNSRKMFARDPYFDGNFSYYTRFHVNVKGQKSLKINVYKIIPSAFNGIIPPQ